MNSVSFWALHEQLARDTIALGDLALSRILVMKDANYPWLLVVPRRPNVTEIIDLDAPERALLAQEIDRVALALKQVSQCDKLNIAALGNMVPQLHVHVIARRKTDKAWPRPVWGIVPPLDYDAEDLDRFMLAMRSKLGMA
jgi:diadenosine tetraphosphate (Ap4A) HIT family hydrolase